jgi:hypothetical protein
MKTNAITLSLGGLLGLALCAYAVNQVPSQQTYCPATQNSDVAFDIYDRMEKQGRHPRFEINHDYGIATYTVCYTVSEGR